MSENKSAITAIVLTGMFTVIGTVAGSVIKGYWDAKLAERNYTSDLILKALEPAEPLERLKTLQMLLHTNLLIQSDMKDSVDAYVQVMTKHPDSLPQVKPSYAQAIAPQMSVNARIFLLSGKIERKPYIDSISNQLAIAGYSILGFRTLQDIGRPDQPEIRYFNSDDKQQAEQLAAYMVGKLAKENVPANKYFDAKAKPGYVEIWLGR